MSSDLEFVLVHDGKDWVVRGQGMEARGSDLDALDRELTAVLRQSGRYTAGETITVFMGFDFDTIPTWMRQYASHYFNRYVALEI